MKNKIKSYINKENAKKVLKIGGLAVLVYGSAALAVKRTRFDIHLFAAGEEVILKDHN